MSQAWSREKGVSAWRTVILLGASLALACSEPSGPIEPAASTVTGRVLDAGEPVAGAEVSIGSITTLTGSDGYFELDGVPLGPTKVSCFADFFLAFTMDLTVPAGGLDVQVPLERAVTSLRGAVLVASTGSPVVGARVSIGEATTTTASDGGFELSGLVAGSAEILAAATGFEDYRSEVILYGYPGTAYIALRSLAEPGVVFDVTARIGTFDPAWGDKTGAYYLATLTLPDDYRTAGNFTGTMSVFRYVDSDGVHHPRETRRVTGTADSWKAVTFDGWSWTMTGTVQAPGSIVGRFECCGHISGPFTAVPQPGS